MDTNKALTTRNDFTPIIRMVVDGLTSPHSRRAYEQAIESFLVWWEKQGRPQLIKATVNRYKTEVLEKAGLSPSTINVRMSAIRKLAAEAADNGLLPQEQANGIAKVKGVKSAGVRAGNWLTKDQAQRLLNTPDISTVKGLRDRAILAMFLGGGLRRSEVAELTFDQVQQREGRWAIVDLVGKGNRVRTVPIPAWAKVAIDAWAERAGINSGRIFRGVYHYGQTLLPETRTVKGKVLDNSMTPQAVYSAVQENVYRAFGGSISIGAHDLRRTWAKLARKGGAELTQIQLTLGHKSVAITQRYVGEDQNLTDAPCDRLGLDLSGD